MDDEKELKKLAVSGFIKHNNINIVNINKDNLCATLKADLDENSLNPYGIAHGGLIFGLGDTAMGVTAKLTGKSAVTLSSNISYLKPAKGAFLIAKAEMIKNGKQTCYLRCNIYDEKEVLVSTMDANYFYIN